MYQQVMNMLLGDNMVVMQLVKFTPYSFLNQTIRRHFYKHHNPLLTNLFFSPRTLTSWQVQVLFSISILHSLWTRRIWKISHSKPNGRHSWFPESSIFWRCLMSQAPSESQCCAVIFYEQGKKNPEYCILHLNWKSMAKKWLMQ